MTKSKIIELKNKKMPNLFRNDQFMFRVKNYILLL